MSDTDHLGCRCPLSCLLNRESESEGEERNLNTRTETQRERSPANTEREKLEITDRNEGTSDWYQVGRNDRETQVA